MVSSANRTEASPPVAAPATAVRKREGPAVIFFDGVCGLCNRWVDFVLARDAADRFRLSPLQGETAREWLQLAPDEPLNSIIVLDADGMHRRTDAIVRILRKMEWPWRLAGGLLWAVPRPLRDAGYDFIARHRYRWWGRKDICRMPTPEERAKFLP